MRGYEAGDTPASEMKPPPERLRSRATLYCKCMNLDGRCPNEHWTPPSEQGHTIPRTFDVIRYHDVSGVSGEGLICQGVQFRDGSLAVRWDTPGQEASTAIWPSIEGFLGVHGHNGLTVVRFHDGGD